MDPEREIARLRELSPEAEIWTEGGLQIAFLPGVQFIAKGVKVVRDLLLWPWEREGYQSRLFLSDRVESSEDRNWNAVFNIQGRAWHAISWQGVSNTLPWIEILGAHLRALR